MNHTPDNEQQTAAHRTIVGLDRRGDLVFAVTVETDGVRPIVTRLAKHSVPMTEPPAGDGDPTVRLSVPDRAVLVKHLPVLTGSAESLRDKQVFEISQSLLEPESEFLFDFSGAGDSPGYLGFVFRRQQLAEYLGNLGPHVPRIPEIVAPEHPPFVAHARALGLGYIQFCEQEEGDVVTVVDLTADTASICLVHDNRVADVAHLPSTERYLADHRQLEQLAVDLKTVVNFRLAAMSDRGIRVGPSHLVILGDAVDGALLDAMRKYFPAGVVRPRLQRGYFDHDSVHLDETAERFIPALGLTV